MANISESSEPNDAPVTERKFEEYIATGGIMHSLATTLYGYDGLFHESTVEVEGVAGSYNAPVYALEKGFGSEEEAEEAASSINKKYGMPEGKGFRVHVETSFFGNKTYTVVALVNDIKAHNNYVQYNRDKSILDAAREGEDLSYLYILYADKPLTDITASGGLNAAHLMALNGHTEQLINLLTEHPELADTKTDAGKTIEDYVRGNASLSEDAKNSILDALAKAREANKPASAPLQASIRQDKYSDIAVLERKGVNLGAYTDNYGNSVAHNLARAGQDEELNNVLAKHKRLVTAQDKYGNTIANVALNAGHTELFCEIIGSHPELAYMKNKNGLTAKDSIALNNRYTDSEKQQLLASTRAAGAEHMQNLLAQGKVAEVVKMIEEHPELKHAKNHENGLTIGEFAGLQKPTEVIGAPAQPIASLNLSEDDKEKLQTSLKLADKMNLSAESEKPKSAPAVSAVTPSSPATTQTPTATGVATAIGAVTQASLAQIGLKPTDEMQSALAAIRDTFMRAGGQLTGTGDNTLVAQGKGLEAIRQQSQQRSFHVPS